jgi:hypothetical protein
VPLPEDSNSSIQFVVFVEAYRTSQQRCVDQSCVVTLETEPLVFGALTFMYKQFNQTLLCELLYSRPSLLFDSSQHKYNDVASSTKAMLRSQLQINIMGILDKASKYRPGHNIPGMFYDSGL